MSSNPDVVGERVLFADKKPEGLDRFEIFLSGERGDKVLYVEASSEAKAGGYAYELSEQEGFTDIAITSESEARRRHEEQMEGYQFAWPQEEDIVRVKAPNWGEPVPTVVLVLDDETVEDLFDETKRARREREMAKERRAKRRGNASQF